jgi:hypothetical protein
MMSLCLKRKRLVRRLARLRRRKESEMVPLFTCRGRGWLGGWRGWGEGKNMR